MRVAVLGTGIAGNAAAWSLSKHYPVTVYDRELRPGGHSHTVTIDNDGTRLAVDVGFIVYNELNYPDLTALFAHLGVETVDSCMSFAVTADAGRFEWKGGGHNWFETARGLFAQRRNLLSPSYLWMSPARLYLHSAVGLFLLSRRRRVGAPHLRSAQHLWRDPSLRAAGTGG